MKIRRRNRIRRPSLDRFIRRGLHVIFTTIYTDENGKQRTSSRPVKIPKARLAVVTFGESSGPLDYHYTGLSE